MVVSSGAGDDSESPEVTAVEWANVVDTSDSDEVLASTDESPVDVWVSNEISFPWSVSNVFDESTFDDSKITFVLWTLLELRGRIGLRTTVEVDGSDEESGGVLVADMGEEITAVDDTMLLGMLEGLLRVLIDFEESIMVPGSGPLKVMVTVPVIRVVV